MPDIKVTLTEAQLSEVRMAIMSQITECRKCEGTYRDWESERQAGIASAQTRLDLPALEKEWKDRGDTLEAALKRMRQ